MSRDPHAERRAPEPIDPNWRHPIEVMEPEVDGASYSEEEVSEGVWAIIARLKKSSCAPMMLDCMCLAVGANIYYREDGQVLADRYGVSRQRIHNLKEQLQEEMGIIGGVFAKKPGARATYSLTNHRPRKKCLN